jgi:hypothetical protein
MLRSWTVRRSRLGRRFLGVYDDDIPTCVLQQPRNLVPLPVGVAAAAESIDDVIESFPNEEERCEPA